MSAIIEAIASKPDETHFRKVVDHLIPADLIRRQNLVNSLPWRGHEARRIRIHTQGFALSNGAWNLDTFLQLGEHDPAVLMGDGSWKIFELLGGIDFNEIDFGERIEEVP